MLVFCGRGRMETERPLVRSSRLSAPSCDLHVNRRGILGIDARLEAVAAADAVPVACADAGAVAGARGPADGAVVLGAAADVVERLRVVGGDTVVLRQRQVGEVPPRLHAVVGLVEAAVVRQDDVVPVGGIEHDVVMIDVRARPAPPAGPRDRRAPCRATPERPWRFPRGSPPAARRRSRVRRARRGARRRRDATRAIRLGAAVAARRCRARSSEPGVRRSAATRPGASRSLRAGARPRWSRRCRTRREWSPWRRRRSG